MPNFIFQRLVFDKVGLYATNPFRVLFSIVVVNFIFSLIYTFFYSEVNTLTCLDYHVSFTEKVYKVYKAIEKTSKDSMRPNQAHWKRASGDNKKLQ